MMKTQSSESLDMETETHRKDCGQVAAALASVPTTPSCSTPGCTPDTRESNVCWQLPAQTHAAPTFSSGSEACFADEYQGVEKCSEANLQDRGTQSGHAPNSGKICVPFYPTKGELRSLIPLHCFERSAPRSIGYLVRNGAMVIMLFGLAIFGYTTTVPDSVIGLFGWMLGWSLYSFCQGTVAMGLWVIAHECGHGAFSTSQTMNDCIGFVLHSMLLVPYFSWQFSHRKHHRATNHIVNGETFVPFCKELDEEMIGFVASVHSVIGDDAFAILYLLVSCLIGWPSYLLANVTGGHVCADWARPSPNDVMDHFRPTSKLFPSRMKVQVLASTGGILLWIVFLCYCAYKWSIMAVLCLYGGPYLWVNAWLVIYTRLHHSSPDVPHYGDEDWTWIKGALCTIDRPYGFFDWLHHCIGSTHVVHHLFPEIPWYHAAEATSYIKERLGDLYRYDDTPVWKAAYLVARDCHYVDGAQGTQFFKRFPINSNQTVS